ncbi:peptide/nickel transport system permease protein [Desulfacinum infernum DSM 9756]|uniref:Peptide/nickel transport system permease protein n=1 Tax=Desulfacinum infernum DSM 9756 TaxID=1121391 RepID=A0A1M5HIE0_9BACT|nr:ABC transporter permease [Desulfacinum infernum]SHG15658.1 peptide/nickel transport system permease protein [Desulfacinum infernum DSM 9756]
MFTYVVRRILQSIPILFVVLTLVFVVVRVLPGDPAVAALGDYASKEAVEALREKMGLNAPLWLQYIRFLGSLARGDLGISAITGYPVAQQVVKVLPHTLELTFCAIVFGYLLGIPLGISSAVKRNTFVDYFNRVFSLLGLSVPAFYLGILLILLFCIQFPLFPVVGAGDFSRPVENLRHLFLPGLTLGLLMTAYVTRMTRSSILDTIREDFVRTAYAKGVAERVVLYKHVLRNAMIPIVTLGGLYAVVLIGSSVMVEIVFSRPGLGKLMVGAIKQRDYTTLQSVMVIYAVIVVMINLAIDLIYGLIDPRIKYD